MSNYIFSDDDLRQFRDLGINEKQVRAQIEIFKKEDFFLKVHRPCTIGDGITNIPESAIQKMSLEHQEAVTEERLLKFVPASGAASRMFKTLIWFNNNSKRIERSTVVRQAEAGDKQAKDIISFMEGIRNFAFFKDLKSVMERDDYNIDDEIESGEFKDIIKYLLTERGLNYVSLPKGLLKFHDYPDDSRTPMEEHLVEAANYIRDGEGVCRLHFTVSPEHEGRFRTLLDEVKSRYEKNFEVQFRVEFSVQKRSTDTIAVDTNNRPFREKDGTLLFRPGGHGALIENLNEIEGDIIYIKNIDNVVPDRLKGETFTWKRILGGYLIEVQKKIFGYMERLTGGEEEGRVIEEALEFTRDRLFIVPTSGMQLDSDGKKKNFLLNKLNRPIRVCGVVRNVGEPGGGPFWVEGKDGSLSLQIVESAQINMEAKEQQEIWNAATYFNPVDIVCGVRDYKGIPFDLRQYVDQDAVFISQKSKDGRDLKALELPGLWNGAMADWITIFVEVPIITFNPVKTINDLLRKEHQP